MEDSKEYSKEELEQLVRRQSLKIQALLQKIGGLESDNADFRVEITLLSEALSSVQKEQEENSGD